MILIYIDALSQPNDTNPINYELCIHVYNELLNRYHLQPTEIEFVYMLRLCLNTKNKILFNQILSSLMNEITLPESKVIRNIIVKWYETIEMDYIIKESIVSNEGMISCNQEQLLSLDLEEAYRNELLLQLEGFVLQNTTNENDLIHKGVYKMNNKVKAYHESINNLKKDCNPHITNINNNTTTILEIDHKITTEIINRQNQTIKSDIIPNENIPSKDENIPNKNEKTLNYRKKTWDSFKYWLEIHHKDRKIQLLSEMNTTIATANDVVNNNHHSIDDQKVSDMKELKDIDLYNMGFNIIVDGANVGYCKQNYPGAPTHIDYLQINQLLIHLIKIGYKPLLILHCRHLNQQMIPNEQCQHVIKYWQENHLIYSTPKG